ncbi:MAG: thioredoxin domain-containing protein [Proteobacteria bacterium]|nr:thioredoxin domain-containing protein [Pseudomonadota bacterium]
MSHATRDASGNRPANALATETSPYLLQHAHNPVDWHPWGPAALALARTTGKPILLSIGYSACHWCHVMAHESFEDAATAQVMNELFVNIKVDREERPDLDRIYQLAHQMLTQRGGGWPLTMFLTHDDQRPFFGGTYFPDKPRHGMPAFVQVIQRVAQYYREQASEMRQQNDALMTAFAAMTPPVELDRDLTDQPLAAGRQQLAEQFDKHYGGFGSAPKFPHPGSIEFLLQQWYTTAATPEPDLHALYMSTLTLTRMAEGGLYDQLGGGFARYSVDDYWMIPHFEKMLYDNAALLASYADAYLATSEPLFGRIAGDTADWLIRDMQSPAGGFYSSYDADSEGHEGTFYVWDQQVVRALLPAADYAVFSRRFGLDRDANFEGRWHLHVCRTLDDIAAELSCEVHTVTAQLESARQRLLGVRNERVWPARDDKVLTSWNALAIRALARAARALRRDDLMVAADRAIDFLVSTVWRDSRLLATYKDGKAHLNAYLDDYAFLADALLELLQLRWRESDALMLQQLCDTLLAQFEDREHGGFFFTSNDHETLIHRAKSLSDDATPSGNGIAAQVLLRTGYLLGETRYLVAAERALRAAWRALEKYPQAHVSLLTALREQLSPPEIIILRGQPTATQAWQRELALVYAPHRMSFAIPADAADLAPALASKTVRASTAAYICRGTQCSAPIESLTELVRATRLRLAEN